jgi:pimeloyl-ACP methyl ester carboxylesterase
MRATGRGRRRAAGLLGAAVLAASTACTGPSSPAPTSGAGSTQAPQSSAAPSRSALGPPGAMPTVAAGAACLAPPEQSGVVRFTSGNGASIAGVLLGTGDVGLVLAHQTSSDLCEWMPYARVLSGHGYRTLAIDLNGFGASQPSAGVPSDPRYDQDILAAAEQLHRRGVARVILVGASVGGLAAVVAASEAQPPVAAVVDISGPADLAGMDAVAAAGRLTVPLLCLVGGTDAIAAEVGAVNAAATHAPDHPLVVIPGTASHGVALLDPAYEPKAAQARTAVEGFLQAHAGAGSGVSRHT